MRVAVGSKNPTKLEAVEQAFRLLLPGETVEIVGVETDSGVGEQPMNDEETLQGATNRAKEALLAVDADYGVGLEGGQHRISEHWFTQTAAAVINKAGKIGVGIGPSVLTPSETMEHIHKQSNLSDAVAKSHGVTDIGKKQGLSGLVTKGIITRVTSSRDATIAALSVLL